ncbi:hypothetical protein K504DRAFT_462419 [Pleomassaria siparia CBS 279.74]|uniref:Uncharacterized protein n=1 Tax=Pleomassaria siparia CBS 279.74 TaxID=1314801 RepID=A0A6G1KM96_9PLEO|nr:hypothetical protein K504DRAFT_462419 [Pleomassaria siparia CBS 279.74]
MYLLTFSRAMLLSGGGKRAFAQEACHVTRTRGDSLRLRLTLTLTLMNKVECLVKPCRAEASLCPGEARSFFASIWRDEASKDRLEGTVY